MLRMQRVMKVLAETDRNPDAVAAEIGYQDAFSFSKVFKRTVGMSPKVFRQRDAAARSNAWRAGGVREFAEQPCRAVDQGPFQPTLDASASNVKPTTIAAVTAAYVGTIARSNHYRPTAESSRRLRQKSGSMSRTADQPPVRTARLARMNAARC